LPWDVLVSGTFQFSRGVQNGGAAPSILATWAAPTTATTLGRAYSAGATSRTFNLLPVGENYGNYNLKQLDLRASKRGQDGSVPFPVRLRRLQRAEQQLPFTVSNTFSNTATSNWLRPTNVLQSRFFKLGVNFDF
jgi:hypothetical protein